MLSTEIKNKIMVSTLTASILEARLFTGGPRQGNLVRKGNKRHPALKERSKTLYLQMS